MRLRAAPRMGARKGRRGLFGKRPQTPAPLHGARAERWVVHPHWPQIVFEWPAGGNPGPFR
jgi:hypothetical protein